RQLLLTQRVDGFRDALSAREVLRVATRGGAAVLGRDDVGSLAVGKRADVVLFPLDDLSMVGTDYDPLAALVFCTPPRPRHVVIEGRHVVRDGQLATASEDEIVREARKASRRVMELTGEAGAP
ncbi:MAG TPA: amidohydrolase family protein, partial [Conexibacter sp.]|nr:amidohydrolase family protein [Conexibacter sp.]